MNEYKIEYTIQKRWIEHSGIEVIIAENGKKAIENWKEENKEYIKKLENELNATVTITNITKL